MWGIDDYFAASPGIQLPRVLIVDENPASRLTLKTVLEAGGYGVDSAASFSEALDKLDDSQFELVLSDLRLDDPDAGLAVLEYARLKDYEPAIAMVKSQQSGNCVEGIPILVEPESVQDLLTSVAELISQRAARLVNVQMQRFV